MTASLTVQSAAFAPGAPVAKKYSRGGDNVAPQLEWSGAPKETREFALIMDDPDAPVAEPWVHWVVYAIPASVTSFPEGKSGANVPASPAGIKEGKNTWGIAKYDGPEPPKGHGTHHYHFKVYALDAPVTLKAGATKAELLKAMQSHILAQGEVVGTFER
ncbi:MAG: YbhB/YbcL family Raf kinase inhibitor-like protein [Candidatus Sumerlaeota bacterium]|nr:YbhB/YbcL family Raf kinase inhibitor-like protein [Candidatus Sumerlaeota bacterium]